MTSRIGLKAFLKQSFYEVLGVSEDADAEELKVTLRFSVFIF
jgi:curved DNA-binding protein CbpA